MPRSGVSAASALRSSNRNTKACGPPNGICRFTRSRGSGALVGCGQAFAADGHRPEGLEAYRQRLPERKGLGGRLGGQDLSCLRGRMKHGSYNLMVFECTGMMWNAGQDPFSSDRGRQNDSEEYIVHGEASASTRADNDFTYSRSSCWHEYRRGYVLTLSFSKDS